MSTVRANAILDASGGNTATINSMTPTAGSLQGFRNRIINGDMRIDQRNAGASVTPTDGQFVLDRWKQLQSVASKYSVQQNAGSVTPPTGFANYLGVTSLSAYSVGASDYFAILQEIEGFNSADLAFGTASASTVTISFWVRSSLTGTFGGVIGNSDNNRAYPFTYTISSANTWEQKSVTIAGDTTGTWLTTNGIGFRVKFGLGVGSTYNGTAGSWQASDLVSATGATSVVGTNGATFYITGVQLEVGSVATPFERIDYGRELAMCQRYYEKTYDQSVVPGTATDTGSQIDYNSTTVTSGGGPIRFTITKRDSPTITSYSTNSGASGKVYLRTQGLDVTPSIDLIGQTGARITYTQTSGIVNTTYHWVASSEL